MARALCGQAFSAAIDPPTQTAVGRASCTETKPHHGQDTPRLGKISCDGTVLTTPGGRCRDTCSREVTALRGGAGRWAVLAKAVGWERLVIGGERRVHYDDSDEAWERDIEVDDGEVRWVGADRIGFAGGWNVTVAVMEFVREEPLKGVLRRQIAAEGEGEAFQVGAEGVRSVGGASARMRSRRMCSREMPRWWLPR